MGFICVQVPQHLGREQEAEDQGDQDACHLPLFLPWAVPHLTSGVLAEESECARRRQGCGWPAPRRTPHCQRQTALLGRVPGGGSKARAVGQSCQEAGTELGRDRAGTAQPRSSHQSPAWTASFGSTGKCLTTSSGGVVGENAYVSIHT